MLDRGACVWENTASMAADWRNALSLVPSGFTCWGRSGTMKDKGAQALSQERRTKPMIAAWREMGKSCRTKTKRGKGGVKWTPFNRGCRRDGEAIGPRSFRVLFTEQWHKFWISWFAPNMYTSLTRHHQFWTVMRKCCRGDLVLLGFCLFVKFL